MSPKDLTANVSKAVLKLPGLPRLFWWFVRTVSDNMPVDPENHNVPLMRLLILVTVPKCSGLKGGKAAEITPGYSLIIYSITEAPPLLRDHKA